MLTRIITLVSLLAGSAAQAASLTPVQQLGRELFFDKISSPATLACADCHAKEFGWTGPSSAINERGAVYPGAIPERFGNRKPPSAGYVSFAPPFQLDPVTGEFAGGTFWDGRATGEHLGSPAADQAVGPFLNPVEQNMADAAAVCRHVAASAYAGLFQKVWGRGSLDCSPAGAAATYGKIGISIAEYEASPAVSPFMSKFDAYLRACLAAGNPADACGLGEAPQAVLDPTNVLTAQEFEGLVQFGEYCAGCHDSVPRVAPGGAVSPPLLTDFSFANIGVPPNPENPFYGMDRVLLANGQPVNPLGAAYVDRGLGDFLRTRPEWAALAPAWDGAFRVPTLRNVDKRAGKLAKKAYMHNGALKSLDQVVHFYNTRDLPSARWAPPEVAENVTRELVNGKPLGDLQLDATLEAAIVAFLRTLTDDPSFAPK